MPSVCLTDLESAEELLHLPRNHRKLKKQYKSAIRHVLRDLGLPKHRQKFWFKQILPEIDGRYGPYRDVNPDHFLYPLLLLAAEESLLWLPE